MPDIGKRYTLDELIAQCDPDAPMPLDLREWEQAEPVGIERNVLTTQINKNTPRHNDRANPPHKRN